MSASDEEISNVGASNRHGCEVGDGDDDEEDDTSGDHGGRNEYGKKNGYYGLGKYIGKAKQVVLHQSTNAKKQLHIRSNKRALRSSSGNGSRNSGKGCYFCFSRPQVVESPNGSPLSDPNDPNFTYAMLKSFIEKNDFYSKDCNPHID